MTIRMCVIELTYKKPLAEADHFLEEHRRFLDRGYQAGLFIASGVKNPRDGGVIIALGERGVIAEKLKEDPFYQHDVAEYKTIEFCPSKSCDMLKPLLL